MPSNQVASSSKDILLKPTSSASTATGSKRSASPDDQAAKKTRKRNQDKRDVDAIAAEFKLCTITLGSLLYLTGAIDKEAESFEFVMYRAIIDGIRDYNIDTQTIKRLVNERLRIQLNDPSITLPASITKLINYLVPSIARKDANNAFHFPTSILNQMVKTLAGNFASMKFTQIFSQLKAFVSRKLDTFFGITDGASSDDDAQIINTCSIALLRIILGKPGLLNREGDDVDDNAISDDPVEIDERGMSIT